MSQLSPAPFNFPYFSLTFRQWDKIKVIDCDEPTLQLIQEVVTANWEKGIQSQTHSDNVFKIKFRGNPFEVDGKKEEALAIKRLCCTLLTSLYSAGWELSVSSDLSRWNDLTTWFFQRNSTLIGRQLRADGGLVCLSLSAYDKLQLVNAPDYLHTELLECVGPFLQNYEVFGRDREIKLTGYPWTAYTTEAGIKARKLLLDIFRKFDSHKYRFYGTANLKGTADSIFFQQYPNYMGGETRYCMMSLNSNDRIRLIDCPQNMVDMVKRCIEQYWSGGLQDYSSQESYFEYKLKGYPWNTRGDDAVNSRGLITHILQSLVSIGWAVVTALDISRRPSSKSVFILRSCTPASIDHMSISPSSTDKIRLINAPKDVQNAVANIIHANWPKGIQREGERPNAYEWKLHGRPWASNGSNDYIMSRHLMTLLLNATAKMGWRVICSADASAKYIHQEHGPDYSIDVHSWFLARTGHESQEPDTMESSSYVDLEMPSAPLLDDFPPPPSYNEIMNKKS